MTQNQIRETLAALTQEAKETDATAEALAKAAEAARERARQLKERSDKVQRKLAAST